MRQRFTGSHHADPTGYLDAPKRDRPPTRPCPECGHVYKKPGLADAEGRCLNGKACARHRTLGY